MNDYKPQNGEWNEAYYMLSTMSLEGKVNGIHLEKKTDGSIKQSQATLKFILDTEEGFRTSRVI